MSNDRAMSPKSEFAGWRIIRSDAGRLWASRVRPFPVAAERAGAWRTVDADDLRELGLAIAEQEAVAEQAAPALGNDAGREKVAGQVSAAGPAATA
ncbi:hypothetical protein ACFHYQ_25595 [Sphaerimonospora cavernae]|uniref:Uncharacterized protein n=1 Tax=Sphaerimonospora cavernae TaxID=1740611 RepID=A0ABV6UC16_9ACTN